MKISTISPIKRKLAFLWLVLTFAIAIVIAIAGNAWAEDAPEAPSPLNRYLYRIDLSQPNEQAGRSPDALQEVVLQHSHGAINNPATGNRNRVVYIDGAKRNHPVMFPVRAGSAIVAGDGRLLGHLASNVHAVQLNFGQNKMMGSDGAVHLLAFATATAEGGPVSGWIRYADLSPSAELDAFDGILAMKAENVPDHGDAPNVYRVACAAPRNWGEGFLKIVPNVDEALNKNDAATDYVERPNGHVCYLLLSLPRYGGVATDVLGLGDVFIPSAGVPQVRVPLYLPKYPTVDQRTQWNAFKVPHDMDFVYGRVRERFGWIATANLRAAH